MSKMQHQNKDTGLADITIKMAEPPKSVAEGLDNLKKLIHGEEIASSEEKVLEFYKLHASMVKASRFIHSISFVFYFVLYSTKT